VVFTLDIETRFKDKKFHTLKEAEAFAQTEIPEKLRSFFHWSKSSKLLVRENNKIKEQISTFGYFIIVTNAPQLNKHTVLHYYRDKDKVEKIFDAVKNEMDGDRLRTHSKYTTDGQLFIKYIALIIYMQITRVMREKDLFRKYSIQELLRELAKMKITHMDDTAPIKSEISKKQSTIFKAFGIDPQYP